MTHSTIVPLALFATIVLVLVHAAAAGQARCRAITLGGGGDRGGTCYLHFARGSCAVDGGCSFVRVERRCDIRCAQCVAYEAGVFWGLVDNLPAEEVQYDVVRPRPCPRL